MPKRKPGTPITALPNAHAALIEIGIERAWHDLAMKLHDRIGNKRPNRYGILNAPQEVMFFNGLPDHFGKGTRTQISYDFHLHRFSAEITSDDWRIRETEIVLRDLPECIQASVTGRTVDQIVALPHLAERVVVSLRRRGSANWRMRLQLDEPVPHPITQ
ncbi:hypothetical protein [uncultured Salinicola sp.]|uniref:hypothetical protein n=1 Tax=uncultured Salinicola sp. TaxID=1193542 RepID=UPI002626F1E4|nr:hypothetical protein [uncultured Salinicola sp.]|tara:strand:+ start:1650 stop:2129 length:480 start_codon:yes stop_codon:yes gene_type:complete